MDGSILLFLLIVILFVVFVIMIPPAAATTNKVQRQNPLSAPVSSPSALASKTLRFSAEEPDRLPDRVRQPRVTRSNYIPPSPAPPPPLPAPPPSRGILRDAGEKRRTKKIKFATRRFEKEFNSGEIPAAVAQAPVIALPL